MIVKHKNDVFLQLNGLKNVTIQRNKLSTEYFVKTNIKQEKLKKVFNHFIFHFAHFLKTQVDIY